MHLIKWSVSVLVLVCFTYFSEADEKPAPISWEQASSNLGPTAVTDSLKKVNPEGIKGRVLCGYQGWFRAEGDGSQWLSSLQAKR